MTPASVAFRGVNRSIKSEYALRVMRGDASRGWARDCGAAGRTDLPAYDLVIHSPATNCCGLLFRKQARCLRIPLGVILYPDHIADTASSTLKGLRSRPIQRKHQSADCPHNFKWHNAACSVPNTHVHTHGFHIRASTNSHNRPAL